MVWCAYRCAEGERTNKKRHRETFSADEEGSLNEAVGRCVKVLADKHHVALPDGTMVLASAHKLDMFFSRRRAGNGRFLG